MLRNSDPSHGRKAGLKDQAPIVGRQPGISQPKALRPCLLRTDLTRHGLCRRRERSILLVVLDLHVGIAPGQCPVRFRHFTRWVDSDVVLSRCRDDLATRVELRRSTFTKDIRSGCPPPWVGPPQRQKPLSIANGPLAHLRRKRIVLAFANARSIQTGNALVYLLWGFVAHAADGTEASFRPPDAPFEPCKLHRREYAGSPRSFEPSRTVRKRTRTTSARDGLDVAIEPIGCITAHGFSRAVHNDPPPIRRKPCVA
jgi:hypothetical protein